MKVVYLHVGRDSFKVNVMNHRLQQLKSNVSISMHRRGT